MVGLGRGCEYRVQSQLSPRASLFHYIKASSPFTSPVAAFNRLYGGACRREARAQAGTERATSRQGQGKGLVERMLGVIDAHEREVQTQVKVTNYQILNLSPVQSEQALLLPPCTSGSEP